MIATPAAGRPILLTLLATLVLALVSGCSLASDLVERSPLGGGRPSVDQPDSGSPSGPAAADVVLAQALDHFEQASSFRFQASAVHQWEFDGRLQEWIFVGEGAYESPDRFYSRMEGPADADLRLIIDGSTVEAYDARGPVEDPSTAFGGPGNGASPFSAIAYLRNYQQASQLSPATLGNDDVYVISFVPNLATVAALDAGQSQALGRVRQVEGQVWVDKQQPRILQEQVTVTYAEPNGAEATVQMTLRFSDFNQPVTIERP